MNPQAQVTAAGVDVIVEEDGHAVTYHLKQLTLRDLSQLTRQMVSEMPDPIKDIDWDSLPEDMRRFYAEKAWEEKERRNRLGIEDTLFWVKTNPIGTVWLLYHMLKRDHPDMTFEKVEALLTRHGEGMQDVLSTVVENMGLPEGNSPRPPGTTTDESAGGPSSGNSQKSTDGPSSKSET